MCNQYVLIDCGDQETERGLKKPPRELSLLTSKLQIVSSLAPQSGVKQINIWTMILDNFGDVKKQPEPKSQRSHWPLLSFSCLCWWQ